MAAPHRRREASTLRPNWSVLGIYLMGVFIGALDTTVIGPAFPLIAHGLHVSLAWNAWAITVYTVAYAGCTVLAGAGGDRAGRRRLFTLGVATFGVASLLAALSGTFWLFLVARGLQGMGAGAVYPNAQAEGIGQFPAERRGMALGIFGAVFGLASIIGPNVGGVLAQYLGWRSIFLLNVPIALIVLARTRTLPESVSSGGALPDWIGGVSFAGLLATILLTFSLPGIWRVLAAAGALGLAGLFWARQRGAATPFLDTRPLAKRSGLAMLAGAVVIGLDLSAAVFVPTLVQRELGFSVLLSGVALMPAAFMGAILAGAGGVLVDRIGPRTVLQVGLLTAVLGGLLLSTRHLTILIFVLAMLALGVSTAFTMGAPLNRMALGLYREEQAGEALSLVAVFRAAGLAAGPVFLMLIAAHDGFPSMFLLVALASALGILLFFGVPDVRPAHRPRHGAPAEQP